MRKLVGIPEPKVENGVAVITVPCRQKGDAPTQYFDVIIDADDWPRINADLRHLSRSIAKSGKIYVYARIRATGESVRLHRWLMGQHEPDGYVVDHIDNNGLDNRKKNLRVTTVTINNLNRNVRTKAESGFRNVYRRPPRRESFHVRIALGDRKKYIGTFRDAMSAALAYVAALAIADPVAAANYLGAHGIDPNVELPAPDKEIADAIRAWQRGEDSLKEWNPILRTKKAEVSA